MKEKKIRRMLVIVLAIVLLLPACRSQPEPAAATPAAPIPAAGTGTPAAPQAASAGTAIDTATVPAVTEGPDQQVQATTEAPASVYPGPGAEGQVLPTQTGVYPGPGTEFEPQGTQPAGAYPGPGDEPATSVPTQAQAPPTSQPEATAAAGTPAAQPTAESSPTPPATAATPATPTRSIPTIDPRLRATDPSKVRLASGKVQFVEFFAFWCGPCQAMAPVIHELEARYGDRMNFIYLDIDNPANDELKKTLHYRKEPHFFLLDEQGEVLKEWMGLVPDEAIQAEIEAALD